MKIKRALSAALFSCFSFSMIAVSAPMQEENKKSTEMSFDEVLVQGQYHFSDEAVTTVEDDKILDSLLGIRKDFKDRMKKSVSQQ
jgi:hypothetical protein